MERASDSLVTWTQVVYGLHVFNLLTGILGTATVVGAFLTGWPSIIAVILNYVKRSEARGTWLGSHFRRQIRTFWFGLLWISLCVGFIIVTFGIGILITWLPMIALGLWFVYRTCAAGLPSPVVGRCMRELSVTAVIVRLGADDRRPA